MINIFISYSSKDKNFIKIVINSLSFRQDRYSLRYYEQAGEKRTAMEEIINKLTEIHLFVVFISNDSLNSPFVRQELSEIIRLIKTGCLKEICPILLDNSINPDEDNRIPQYLKNYIFYYAKSPAKAAQIIKDIQRKYSIATEAI